MKARKLSATMTLREFENGYWYLEDLKDFAIQIRIPAATRLPTRLPTMFARSLVSGIA